MSLSVTLAPTSFSLFSQARRRNQHSFPSFHLDPSKLTPTDLRYRLRLQASRRNSNFPQGSDSLVDDPRNWSRSIGSAFGRMTGYDDDEGEDDEDDEEEDRSLDLFVKFVQNVFKKISRRARREVRSVLPIRVPTKLVAFSVNGVLILAFLWVLKAFLEVVCTLGTVVFVSILVIRGIWTGVTYLQINQTLKMNGFDDENSAWNNRAQPAS